MNNVQLLRILARALLDASDEELARFLAAAENHPSDHKAVRVNATIKSLMDTANASLRKPIDWHTPVATPMPAPYSSMP